jgi:hypothetical protein
VSMGRLPPSSTNSYLSNLVEELFSEVELPFYGVLGSS